MRVFALEQAVDLGSLGRHDGGDLGVTGPARSNQQVGNDPQLGHAKVHGVHGHGDVGSLDAAAVHLAVGDIQGFCS